MQDPFGAFCQHGDLRLPGATTGPLVGLTFAAKDLFDIAGYVTGAGNPDWLRTHTPAGETAPAVRMLLDAGATLVGKTLTDELAFSMSGENIHYGTPVNPAAPGRIPGGSSSGSASATAGRLVDFALGTDTSGSIRVPASYCGLFGMRPTHGRVSCRGVVPLAPSLDTVGWFAREALLLQRIGGVLLAEHPSATLPTRILIADDAFALVEDAVRDVFQMAVAKVLPLSQTVEYIPCARRHWRHGTLWNWCSKNTRCGKRTGPGSATSSRSSLLTSRSVSCAPRRSRALSIQRRRNSVPLYVRRCWISCERTRSCAFRPLPTLRLCRRRPLRR